MYDFLNAKTYFDALMLYNVCKVVKETFSKELARTYADTV